MTRKILCENHNSILSRLDEKALSAFQAFGETIELNKLRREDPYVHLKRKRFEVDGESLERWFLKTLINVSFGGEEIIGPGNHAKGTIPAQLVEITFGQRNFENGAGLYVANYAEDKSYPKDRISLNLDVRGANLLSGTFVIPGYRFVLNLFPEGHNKLKRSNLFYRETIFVFEINRHESHRLTLKWPSPSRKKGIASN